MHQTKKNDVRIQQNLKKNNLFSYPKECFNSGYNLSNIEPNIPWEAIGYQGDHHVKDIRKYY